MLNEWTENTVTTVTTTVKRSVIEVSDEEEDTSPTEALRQLQALQQERQQEAAATARRNGGAFKLGSTSQEDEVWRSQDQLVLDGEGTEYIYMITAYTKFEATID